MITIFIGITNTPEELSMGEATHISARCDETKVEDELQKLCNNTDYLLRHWKESREQMQDKIVSAIYNNHFNK